MPKSLINFLFWGGAMSERWNSTCWLPIHTYTHSYTFIHTFIHIHTWNSTCWLPIHTHTHTFIHIHTYILTYILIYILTVVQYAGLNPMGTATARAGCPAVNLRRTLRDLTDAGFSVVVCEELPIPVCMHAWMCDVCVCVCVMCVCVCVCVCVCL